MSQADGPSIKLQNFNHMAPLAQKVPKGSRLLNGSSRSPTERLDVTGRAYDHWPGEFLHLRAINATSSTRRPTLPPGRAPVADEFVPLSSLDVGRVPHYDVKGFSNAIRKGRGMRFLSVIET